jgi:uncharacterized protein
MKISILINLVIALLVGSQAYAQQQIMPPMVHVNGVGEIRVQPDQVVMNIGIEIRDQKLDQARKQVDARAAAIISYLKKQGVPAKDIQTSFVNVQPIYEGVNYGKASPSFYQAQKTMVILIRKLDRFDEITTGLYDVGINRIDGISFQVSDIEKYKAEARNRAVQNAKQKATSLTAQLGSKLGRVYSIQEVDNYGGPRPYQAKMMMAESSMDQAEGPTIAGGEVVITSKVDVSFVIE